MKKHFITEKSYETFTLTLLALAIIYVILSLLPTAPIKRIFTYGPEIDIFIFAGAATYIVKYSLEQLSKYLSYKSGILARVFEIFFGIVLIFLMDFIPFLLDFDDNRFPILSRVQMVLFGISFLLIFIIHPIMKLYYLIQYKKIDLMYEMGMKLIEEEKNRKLMEVDLECKKSIEEMRK